MGKNNNFIEINGKRYDSQSGAVMSHSAAVTATTKPAAAVAKQVKHSPAVKKAKSVGTTRTRQTAKHLPAHKPIPAQTLMRHAVKKPARGQPIRAYGPAQELAHPPLGTVVVGKPVQSLDAKRQQKAAQVAKSQLISHFSATTTSDFAAASVFSGPSPSVSTPPSPVAKHKPTANLLENALRHANSHQQAPYKSPRTERTKHRTAVSAAVVVPLLLLGIIASQNLSGIRLQMASARIGFNAKLPDYRPAGFSSGQLNYSPGVVAAHFHSNSDDRAYTLIQQRSSWDNLTLRQRFVASADSNYQTVEAGGRTVFLYGTQNATWLNRGIWYIVQSNGSLNNRQLLELATSL